MHFVDFLTALFCRDGLAFILEVIMNQSADDHQLSPWFSFDTALALGSVVELQHDPAEILSVDDCSIQSIPYRMSQCDLGNGSLLLCRRISGHSS